MNQPTIAPGVHLLHVDEVGPQWLEAWQQGFARDGVSARVARLEGGGRLHDVLGRLGRALDFPAYYGQNMDAAWDCLNDLTEPTLLLWCGWQDFAVAEPEDWAALVGMFDERCAKQPDFAVVLAR